MKRFTTLAVLVILAISIIACGNRQPQGAVTDFRSPNPSYARHDLSREAHITIYNLSDTVAPDREEVIEYINDRYMRPILNTTIEPVLLPNVNAAQMYPLLLAGGSDVDIIFTAPWRFYNEEAAKGSFVELTDDFLSTYMPNILATQPALSWVQARVYGAIYAVPAAFANFEHKFGVIREDLRLKYNLPPLTDWATLEQYAFTVSANEPGVPAYNTAATTWELMCVYMQHRDILLTPQPVYFAWHHTGGLPDPNDLHFFYTSEWYRDYALTMARWYAAGAWGRNVMNQTVAVRDQFVQGRSATHYHTTAVFGVGVTMEENGFGTPSWWEISPDTVVRRRSYDTNMWAIAATSNNIERAALALDLMKTNDELLYNIRFGIEGRHWIRTSPTTYTPGPEASGYPAGHWVGGAFDFPRNLTIDWPVGTPQAQIEMTQMFMDRTVDIEMDGFRFDVSSMATEWAVMSALIEEYRRSFECGIFEGQTDARFTEWGNRLRQAGLDRMVALARAQYTEYRNNFRGL